MTRLPFDPSKMAAARDAGGRPPAADQPMRVSQLAARIEQAVRGVPSPCRVVGEVTGFRERTHWYFGLKDAEAVIDCVVFAPAARKAGFTPSVGQEVVLTGRVDFYAKAGRVSFVADKIEPVGAGALDLKFKQLVEEIRALGWFDPSRKRRPPAFPRRIAVITSRSGAALQDVLNTMAKRCPAVGVVVVDVRVQGEGAAEEIARAIDRVGREHARLAVDAVLVTRGGGSMEDLWAFNEKAVARAIVECPVPVVAAIGHETDTTIAELVADERASTPTQAAMRLTPDRAALHEQVRAQGRRLERAVSRRIELLRERVRGLARRPVMADPAELIELAEERLRSAESRVCAAARDRVATAARAVDQAAIELERRRPAAVLAQMAQRVASGSDRLGRAARALIRQRAAAADALEKQLRAVGPIAVLERGFSATTKADGTLLRSTADVSAGELVRTRLADGSFDSRVEGAPLRVVRRPKPKPDGGPGLFGV